MTTKNNPWHAMRGERFRYAMAILALAAGICFAFAAPLFARAAIDGLRGGNGNSFTLSPGLAALLMVLFTALGASCQYLMGRLSAQATEEVTQRLRNRLYAHLQAIPCQTLDGRETGDLVQRCTSDVETVRLFLSAQVIQIGRVALMLTIAPPILFWLDPPLTLVTVVGLPFILVAGTFFFRRFRESFRLADEAEGRLTGVIEENIRGIRVVRAFGNEALEGERFARANALFRDRNDRLLHQLAHYWAFSDFLCMGQLGLILLAGAYWLDLGRLSVGTLFAFLVYANLLLWPIRQAGRTLVELGKATVALSRIQEILAEPIEEDLHDVASRAGFAPVGAIEIRDLRFAYPGGREVLRGVSCRIEAGETVALMGLPGAGKSTLIRLLLRLYDYEQGTIRVDGAEIRSVPRSVVRRKMAAVLQDSFLYGLSVRANLRAGDADASEARLIESAREASVHDEVEALPEGYATLVGERGTTLSGGQRQRLAIARAFLKEEAPILILDDSLSAVDSLTEETIRESLLARHGQRTTILIAHRLSTVRDADRVIFIEDGRVAEEGTHEELACRRGPYGRLLALAAELDGRQPEDPCSKELAS